MSQTLIATLLPRLMADAPLALPTAALTTNMAEAEDALPTLHELLHWSTRLSHAAAAAAIAVALALALHWLGFALLRRVARRADVLVDSAEADRVAADALLIARFQQSARWALVAVMIAIAGEADPLIAHLWGAVARFVVPALVGWVILSLVGTLSQLLQNRAGRVADDITARTRSTRIALLSRATGFVIIVFTAGMIMLGFPGVRHIGATLLASAGLIGIAFGAAAQPALKSLIAGLQLALTEPVRIGDLVVVEGESGRVEDIRLSYVVIRTAEERRMIVPTTKFLDSSFQNWTRVGGITGAVLLPVMPGVAIAPIRAAFERLLAAQAGWDKRSGQLQVAEVKAGLVELKLMMSAADPTQLAELRLAMREAMLEWLRQEMPEALCREQATA